MSSRCVAPGNRSVEPRWSMISTWREGGREKLEGSMLAVCTDCRSMVLQVGAVLVQRCMLLVCRLVWMVGMCAEV